MRGGGVLRSLWRGEEMRAQRVLHGGSSWRRIASQARDDEEQQREMLRLRLRKPGCAGGREHGGADPSVEVRSARCPAECAGQVPTLAGRVRRLACVALCHTHRAPRPIGSLTRNSVTPTPAHQSLCHVTLQPIQYRRKQHRRRIRPSSHAAVAPLSTGWSTRHASSSSSEATHISSAQ